MTRAAYFDVDGTLVGTTLLHPTLMYLANQASPVDSLRRIAGVALDTPFLVMAEMRDRRGFNEKLFAHFRGMSEDRLICMADEIYDEVVAPRMFHGTDELIGKCKDAGMRVVLVTGALDHVMEPLRRRLGADAVIANRLEMKDRVATGKLMRPVVAGPGKAQLIVQDARAHGCDLAACHAYSDSMSDVPMLSVVGHPFCVNPDKDLRRLARAYDWPVLDLDMPSAGVKGRRRLPFGFYAAR